MINSDRLFKWHALWRLCDQEVICKTCHAEQEEAEAELPFEHSRACTFAVYATFPWKDLNRITTGFTGSKV